MHKNSIAASVVCRHGQQKIEVFWTKYCSTPFCRKERSDVPRDIAFTSHLICYNGQRKEGKEGEKERGKGSKRKKKEGK